MNPNCAAKSAGYVKKLKKRAKGLSFAYLYFSICITILPRQHSASPYS
jgi:hypothetical protein